MQGKVSVALFFVFVQFAIARRCHDMMPMCYDQSMLPSFECEPLYYGRSTLFPMEYRCDRPLICDENIMSILPCTLDYACTKPMCCEECMLPTGPERYEMPMLPVKDCGYFKSMYYDCSTLPCNFECIRSCCNKELVLPPMRVEMPQDLGYFPSAVPLASSYFRPAVEVGVCAGASVPVTSPCSCLVLAAPVSPDIASLVRSVIL